jgi:microcystin-dependent protein
MSYNSGINQRVRNQQFFNNTINEDYSIQETNLSLIANLKYVQTYFSSLISDYLVKLNPNFVGTLTSSTDGNIILNGNSYLSVPTITSATNFIQNPTVNINSDIECYVVGELKILCQNDPPLNFVLCNGASININTYPKLFQLIGFSYGGSINTGFYNLPNFQSSYPIGANGTINNIAVSNFAYGNGQQGAKNTFSTHYDLSNSLIVNVPPHTHNVGDEGHQHNLPYNTERLEQINVTPPIDIFTAKLENQDATQTATTTSNVSVLNQGENIIPLQTNINGVNITPPYLSTFIFICCQ